MSHLDIIMLALALSMDACIVSFGYGMLPFKNPTKVSLLIAIFTGCFQLLMPIAGYYLTGLVFNYVIKYANIIVFVIFLALGVKFIIEGFENKDSEKNLCISVPCLLIIGFATSIDAFAAGISFKLFCNSIIKPAVLIGFVTFINSCVGFLTGKLFNKLPKTFLEIISGLIMIGLGVKFLL